MAVLFQLGVAYMQGHYVHEPEVVLADAGRYSALSLSTVRQPRGNAMPRRPRPPA